MQERFYGRKVILADRDMVEQNSGISPGKDKYANAVVSIDSASKGYITPLALPVYAHPYAEAPVLNTR